MNPISPISGARAAADAADLHAASPGSAADQQALAAASLRLRNALHQASSGDSAADVPGARLSLRALAVKLQENGFWRADKQGLRATVSLLWEADRYVNDQALLPPLDPEPRSC